MYLTVFVFLTLTLCLFGAVIYEIYCVESFISVTAPPALDRHAVAAIDSVIQCINVYNQQITVINPTRL